MIQWNTKTRRGQPFRRSSSNAYGLLSDKVTCFEIDRFNHLWVGTFESLSKLSLNEPQFKFYQQEPGIGHDENLIYRAHQFDNGSLIYRTYDTKIYHNKSLGKKAAFIATDVVHDFTGSGLEIWTGNSDSLYYFDFKRKITKNYRLNKNILRGGFNFIDEDFENQDYLWMNSTKGLCKASKRTLTKTTFFPITKDLKNFTSDPVFHSWQMPNGYIYVQTMQGAQRKIIRFNKKTERYDYIAVPDSLPAIRIRQMAYAANEKDTLIWVASPQGLVKINHNTKAVELITVDNGLPGNDIMGLMVDHDGLIWLKNMRHVTRYHPENGEIQSFSATKDMREFNTIGASIRKDERILFPGNNGFYAFYPDSIGVDSTRPDLVLTDFLVANEPYDSCAPELIPKQEIVLRHNQNVVSFDFAALHYVNPENIRYKYMLVGQDEEWVNIGAERRATYTNLDPKNYTFKVQATNSDGIWSPDTLKVHFTILPPWYRTWWAYTLWTLLTAGIIYSIYHFQLSRRLAEQKASNLEELNTAKSRLYQNITHEFRTPLTLILGTAEELRAGVKKSQHKYVKRIEDNGRRLLWLINQLLDLSKIENGKLTINYVQADIIPYLQSLTAGFETHAKSQKINLQFHAKASAVQMDFDAEKVQQIISNLLSNAIKYNEEGGSVQVIVEQQAERLSIRVEDDGIGIPEKELPHIFDRFHQVDASATRQAEGTGIGLALTKELVELLDGKIEVQSKLGKGSIFTVLLPIRQNAALAIVPAANLKTGSLFDYNTTSGGLERLPARADRPTLLLVEDHGEMLDYLAELLQGEYQLLRAVNGREGLKLAKQNKPDLIVSDVMMPEMDGFTLCELIKHQDNTSHIPVILLTAKADHAARLEGLKYGADAYLEKPFQRDELRLQIKNLLSMKSRLDDLYENDQNGQRSPNGSTDPTLRLITGIITKNLSNSDFSVSELSRQMHLGRQQVYNKVKQIIGMPPSKYITYLRIEKAKELLLDTDENISQIGFMVGFEKHSSFSNTFRNQVGCSPSEFRDKYQ